MPGGEKSEAFPPSHLGKAVVVDIVRFKFHLLRARCRSLGVLLFGQPVHLRRRRDYSERRHNEYRAEDTIVFIDEGKQLSRPKAMCAYNQTEPEYKANLQTPRRARTEIFNESKEIYTAAIEF